MRRPGRPVPAILPLVNYQDFTFAHGYRDHLLIHGGGSLSHVAALLNRVLTLL